MTPRTILQNEQIRMQRSEHIKSVALELFAEYGYHATSISNIAKNASISKGLLYNYFESKERLLKSIISDGFDKIIVSFDPNKDGVLTKEELIFFINSIIDMMQNDKSFWRLYMSLLIQPAVHDSKIVEEYRDKASFVFKMLTEYYVRKGSKDPDSDITVLHMVMDGIFFNYLYDDEFPIDKIKTIIIERFV